MSSTRVELQWGDGAGPGDDGAYPFDLRLGEVQELEAKCGAGLPELFERLSTSRWRFSDIRETVRLGLIGGGMTPAAALTLVKRYCDERPKAENAPTAQAILLAQMFGLQRAAVADEDEPSEGKAEAAETDATTSPPSTPSAA